jgi:predicted DNA binding protein
MATDGTLMEMKDIKRRRGTFLDHDVRATKYLVDSGELFWLFTLNDLKANKFNHFLLAEDEQTYSVSVHDLENFQSTRKIFRGPKIELTDAQKEVIRAAFKTWQKAPIRPSEWLYSQLGKGSVLP